MVLETLTSPSKAIKRPEILLLIGFVYASLALFLSYWVFRDYSSLTMVFLITAAAIPLMYNAIVQEEQKDLQDLQEKFLLREHAKTLRYFMTLFIGVTIALAFWYVVLPSSTISVVFEAQEETYRTLAPAVGNAFAAQLKSFNNIFFNNVRVLAFCILFSFIYGTGAIFILMWNASVIGLAIGNYIRANLAALTSQFGWTSVASYFQIISIGLLQYVVHGIPEILAYFAAGMAGGIISIAVIKHDFSTFKFERILLDSADLLLAALLLLFGAAIIEVWLTPAIFSF
jgi:uncharacterized membrane protein SpoIIM required for sporulation